MEVNHAKTLLFYFVLLLLFTSFNTNGQTLTKHVNFENITFMIPGSWNNYELPREYYIMASYGVSLMVISIVKRRNISIPYSIKNVNKIHFESKGLFWTLNSYAEENTQQYYKSLPAKVFEAAAQISNGKFVSASAITLSENF